MKYNFRSKFQYTFVLSALLAPSVALAQFANQTNPQTEFKNMKQYSDNESVPFDPTPPDVHEGWEGLANLLHKLEPSVDTSLPETRTQAALRINKMITSHHYQSALNEIKKFEREDAQIDSPSVDVQMRFLKGRALTGLGDIAQATQVYQEMSYKYPELAEPWNNLASLQMRAGLIDQAHESLKMAVQIRPDYAIAQKNLGLVLLLKAKRAFENSNQHGGKNTNQIKALNLILSGNNP